MCVVLKGKEAKAIGVYLTDLNHYKDVRRRFREVVEEYGKDYILNIVRGLPCTQEEKSYLHSRIAAI